jgi:hypothetical protein
MLRRPVLRQPLQPTSASRGWTFLHSPPRLLLIGDSGAQGLQLPDARLEVQALRLQTVGAVPRSRVTMLLGRSATYSRVLREIGEGGYDLVYFSGHVGRESNNEASILLYDGFVRGTDLTTLLAARPPAIMIVNGGGAIELPLYRKARALYDRESPTGDVLAHESGRGSGLAQIAMRAGVGVFVGGFGPMSDIGAAQFGIALGTHLLAGQRAAQAMWLARHDVRKIAESYHFIMCGFPDIKLISQEPVGVEKTDGWTQGQLPANG